MPKHTFGAHSYRDGSTTPVLVIPAIHRTTWEEIAQDVRDNGAGWPILADAIEEALLDERVEVTSVAGRSFYMAKNAWWYDKHNVASVTDTITLELLETLKELKQW